MSYSIEFNRQFVRSECGITPLILVGDSNFFDRLLDSYGRPYERIIRSWCVFDWLLGVSEEELMQSLRNRTGTGRQQHWKRHGKWVDDKALINWGRTGIQQAMTLEEIREQNPLIVLNCSVVHLDNGSTLLSKTVTTTNEFDEWIAEAKSIINSSEDVVYPSISFNVEDLKVCKLKRFEGAAVVKYKNFYLSERTEDRYVYTSEGDFTVFDDFDSAMQAAVKAMLRPFRVLPANKDNVYYVIREEGTHNHGMYYCMTRGRRVLDTDDIRYAQTYKRFKDAERQAKRLMEKSITHSIRRVVAVNPE